jgi:hypothetical protein
LAEKAALTLTGEIAANPELAQTLAELVKEKIQAISATKSLPSETLQRLANRLKEVTAASSPLEVPLPNLSPQEIRAEVQKLMGANFLGKEVWQKIYRNVEETPSPPKVLQILRARPDEALDCLCVFIPAVVDNKALPLSEFAKAVNAVLDKAKRPKALSAGAQAEPIWEQCPAQGRWHLVRKDVIPATYGKTAGEQNKILRSELELEIPSARTLAIASSLTLLANNERLYQTYCRTSDKSTHGYTMLLSGSLDGSCISSDARLAMFPADPLRQIGIAPEWKL